MNEISFFGIFVFAFAIGFLRGVEYYIGFIVMIILNIFTNIQLMGKEDAEDTWINKFAITFRVLIAILFTYFYFRYVY